MDRNYIEQHLVIDRYLRDELDDQELAEFEERLVWDSALLDELELASTLRESLRAELADGDYTAATSRVSLGERVMGFLTVPQYAAAASFLVGVMLATLLLAPGPDPGYGLPDPTIRTEIVPLDVLRGTGAPTVVVDPDAWTVFLIDTPDEAGIYRATVSTGEVPWETISVQTNLAPSFAGAVAVGLPGREMAPGSYLVTLERRREDAGDISYDLVQQIPFEVTIAK